MLIDAGEAVLWPFVDGSSMSSRNWLVMFAATNLASATASPESVSKVAGSACGWT